MRLEDMVVVEQGVDTMEQSMQQLEPIIQVVAEVEAPLTQLTPQVQLVVQESL
jgi:hypothetical protein